MTAALSLQDIVKPERRYYRKCNQHKNNVVPIRTRDGFQKTDKQKAVCDILNNHTHGLVYGGSRSGKTTIIVRNMVLRMLKAESRHLITRLRFNHAKTSIWYDTFPKVAKMCFPNVEFKYNKSDWFISCRAQDGGESQLWLGGVDDNERIEKILGNEYSTIFANECSQISYDAITTLRTRLAENSGLNLRFYYDLNPCGKKHWSYQEFIEGLIPNTQKLTKLDRNHIILNPTDNAGNLPAAYLEILESLPERQRQRFMLGLYMNDVEGALWSEEWVESAKSLVVGEPVKTVIAVDPTVSSSETSDECGIVVASVDAHDQGSIDADLSGKMSTATWAQAVVNAYHEHDANEVVAEVNQGGDLVEDAIHAIDPNIKVIKVRASKGKFARAEPVAALYERGKVAHKEFMPELEAQFTEYVPQTSKKSPDRLDAAVWGLTHLMLRDNEYNFRVMVS
jgi:hypothetical protein